MSLTRSFLKSLNLNDDQISAVIEAHSETVTGLNSKYSELETKYNGAKESADRLPEVQKELDELKKDDFKTKFEAEQSAHNALKESVSREKARTAKEKAVRAYYEEKNIRGGNLSIAMRGTDLDSLKLDEEGRLSDTSALDDLVAGDFKSLVTTAHRTVSSGAELSGTAEHIPTANQTMNRLLRGA